MKTKYTFCLTRTIQLISVDSTILKKAIFLLLYFLFIIGLFNTVNAQNNNTKNNPSTSDTINVEKRESNLAQIDSLKKLSIDSLIVWTHGMQDTHFKDFPEIAYFALGQALKEENYKAASSFHGYLSFWNYYNYEINGIDTIIYHRKKQIEYSAKIGDTLLVGIGYFNLATDYNDSNQQTKCIETLLESIEIFKSINNEAKVAEVHTMLAAIYNSTNEPQKAVKLLEVCLPIFIKEKDYFMVAEGSRHFTDAYLILKDYPNALKHINNSIKVSLENEFDLNNLLLIESYLTKGTIYLEKEDYNLAENYYNKALQASLKSNSIEKAKQCRFEIGNVLYIQKKYEEALPHLVAGVQAAEVLSGFTSDYYQKIAACYEKLGLYEKAFEFKQKEFDFEQKITTDKIENIQSESLIKYETGRKDQQLLEQIQIIEQKNWIQRISIGAALLLSILLSMLFYYFQKNRKNSTLLLAKNVVIEERNQQNELLLKEIHHRVKNNLEVVSSLLALQSRQLDDQNAKSAMQESQNRVQSMGIIHQKLYQGENLSAIEMKDYFVNLGEGILDSFGKSEQVKITCVMKELELDVDTAVPIGLIVNELLTNALKYAFKEAAENPEIQIKLERLTDHSLKLHVSDNGIGKSNNEVAKGTGFGSQLIQLLTAQLEGVMNYVADKGSHFSFHFKPTEA